MAEKESLKAAAAVSDERKNLFEGMVSIRAVLEGKMAGIHDRRVKRVLFDRSRAEKKALDCAYLRRMAEVHHFSLEFCDAAEIDELALGTTHGGVIAFTSDRTLPALTESFIRPGGFYVMIEGIEDPYNFGYALRSLYAAGVDGLVLSPRNWMSAAGTVCRSSAGASERLPVSISSGPEAAVLFHRLGYSVICADIKDSKPVYDSDLRFPLFLVVGGEKRGISREMLNAADKIVRLDYGRPFPQALSAASAASILAFEIFRQNRTK